jgi:hypothetical protein
MRGRREGGAARALRPDIEVGDVALLLEQLQATWVGDPTSASELRHLHLTLFLGSLHTSRGAPLPGPPPTIGRRRRLCQSTSQQKTGLWRSGRMWHLPAQTALGLTAWTLSN